MSSKHEKKGVNVEIEAKYKRKVANLEASLKEKTKLERPILTNSNTPEPILKTSKKIHKDVSMKE